MNGIPIHNQHSVAFVSLWHVPFSITENIGNIGLICGCYPTSTIVKMKQELAITISNLMTSSLVLLIPRRTLLSEEVQNSNVMFTSDQTL